MDPGPSLLDLAENDTEHSAECIYECESDTQDSLGSHRSAVDGSDHGGHTEGEPTQFQGDADAGAGPPPPVWGGPSALSMSQSSSSQASEFGADDDLVVGGVANASFQ